MENDKGIVVIFGRRNTDSLKIYLNIVKIKKTTLEREEIILIDGDNIRDLVLIDGNVNAVNEDFKPIIEVTYLEKLERNLNIVSKR